MLITQFQDYYDYNFFCIIVKFGIISFQMNQSFIFQEMAVGIQEPGRCKSFI